MPPRKRKTSLPARAFRPSPPHEANTSPDALEHLGAPGAHPAPNSASRHMLRIGPAGWSYPDWTGFVYPSRRPRGFHEAAYLSEFFDTIEINTSFYQPLKPETAKQWIDLVSANRNFVFAAKLWPWIARVCKVSEHTQLSFVIANNHFQGKAVVNALQLISILKHKKVKVPEPLRQHYPELNAIADQPPAEPTLFPLDRAKDAIKS